jgi:hypothetical protein
MVQVRIKWRVVVLFDQAVIDTVVGNVTFRVRRVHVLNISPAPRLFIIRPPSTRVTVNETWQIGVGSFGRPRWIVVKVVVVDLAIAQADVAGFSKELRDRNDPGFSVTKMAH